MESEWALIGVEEMVVKMVDMLADKMGSGWALIGVVKKDL